MAATPFAAILRHLHRVAEGCAMRDLGDRELLHRYFAHGQETAFAQLVERHGGLVMGVCRRLLQHTQEAEDAFQATFMVLARKAGSIRKRESLTSWLHGVARRVSLKARSAAIRRRNHESRAACRSLAQAPPDLSWHEVRQVLDEELERLPEKYRAPLLLCYLEGKTQDEAARILGWNVGQLRGRLDRGREKLRRRLLNRGVGLSGGLLATALTHDVAVASVPLVASTVKSTLAFVSGHSADTSLSAAALAQGVLSSMTVAKLAGTATVVLAACLLTSGAVILSSLVHTKTALSSFQAEGVQTRSVEAKVEKQVRLDVYGDPLPPGALARLGTKRLRSGAAQFLAFSPDGKRLASWSNRLSIWDTATGQELRQVALRGATVLAFTWLADGKGVAVLDLGENHFYIWDFADPKAEIPPLREPRFEMKVEAGQDLEHYRGFAIAPNGKLLAAGTRGFLSKERPIYVWELATGRRLEELKEPRLLGRQAGNCDAVAFTPDNNSLLVFSGRPVFNPGAFAKSKPKEQTLGIWDLARGRQRKQVSIPLPAMQGYRLAHVLSPDGKTVVMGMSDGSARWWDLNTGTEARFLQVMRKTDGFWFPGVSALAYGPDGLLITGDRDDFVKIWEPADGRLVRTLQGHRSWVEALAVSADGKRIASNGQDGLIRIWDAATGADACPLDSHNYAIGSVAVSPDAKTTATSSHDGTVRFWETETGRQTRRIEQRAPHTLAFNSDGRRLVGTGLGKLISWDVTTTEKVPLSGDLNSSECNFFRLAPDGSKLVTIRANKLSIWEWPAGRLVRTLELPAEEGKRGQIQCESVAFAADGRTLAVLGVHHWQSKVSGNSSAGDGTVEIWDMNTGQRLRRLLSSFGNFNDVAFAPDGSGLVIASYYRVPIDGQKDDPKVDKSIIVLDPVTGKRLRTFPLPGGQQNQRRSVRKTTFSPDGRTLISMEGNGILIFEWATGLVRRKLSGHQSEVLSIALTDDGRRLVSGSLDSTGLVWDISLASLVGKKVDDPTRIWDALASTDAEIANGALGTMARNPRLAVTLAKKHLQAAVSPGSTTLDRLVADLGSEIFAVREKATLELDRLGEMAHVGLSQRKATAKSLETRMRIDRLLQKHDPSKINLERLRQMRAVELLEHNETTVARRVLAALAGGAPEARLTKDARDSLDRMRKLRH